MEDEVVPLRRGTFVFYRPYSGHFISIALEKRNCKLGALESGGLSKDTDEFLRNRERWGDEVHE